MKITVKTLQQKVFSVEIEGSENVGALKTKIKNEQGHAVESQKLIYSGKVLTDDKTLETLDIKDKDFLVLMVAKPKPSPATPAASSSTPAAAPAPATPAPVPAAAPAAAPATPAAEPAAAAAANPPAFGDLSSFLSGDALQTSINNMIEMGFPREQVMRAMRASFNNPDRAVEYLMTGIPAHLEQAAAGGPAPGATAPGQPAAPAANPATGGAAAPAQAAQAAPPANVPQNLFQLAQQQQQQQGGGGGGGGGAANPLAALGAGGMPDLGALANSPQLAQLRDAIQQNPALLQPLIQQLGAQDPRLAQMVAQNPELLLQLLGGLAEEGDFDMEGGGPLPPNTHVVDLTEPERDAVARLEGLGFSRQVVLEAYLACDKNEELAANYLFENGFED